MAYFATDAAGAEYGFSKRDGGTYWYRSPSTGLKNVYRGQERFRYALRNEWGVPTAKADAIIRELGDKQENAKGGRAMAQAQETDLPGCSSCRAWVETLRRCGLTPSENTVCGDCGTSEHHTFESGAMAYTIERGGVPEAKEGS